MAARLLLLSVSKPALGMSLYQSLTHQDAHPIMQIHFLCTYLSPSLFPIWLLSTRYVHQVSPHPFCILQMREVPRPRHFLDFLPEESADDRDSSVSTEAGLWKRLGSRDSILYRHRDFSFLRTIQTDSRALPSNRNPIFSTGVTTAVERSWSLAGIFSRG